MQYRLSVTLHWLRRKESHRKFLLGLSFEKAGLAITNKDYLDSHSALSICQHILQEIDEKPGIEHAFYKTGEAAFHSQAFMENTDLIKQVKTIFGNEWKRIRYHNLVRLGGDIERSGFILYQKATLLGGLLHYAHTALDLKA